MHKKLLGHKLLSLMLFFVILLSSINVAFAGKDSDEAGEYTDEEWEEIQEEITAFDGDEDWDHQTWDEDHKELVWTVFVATEWTDGSFPNLNFSKFGSNSASLSKINTEWESIITDTVKNQKYITGKYSVKTNDPNTGQRIVDNSAYVPLVLACMDVLKESSTNSDDPFNMWKYVDGGNRTPASYNPNYYPDNKYIENVAKQVYRKIVNGESTYNAYHHEKANIFRINDAGTKMMIQSVVLDNMYCRRDSYSYEDATTYYDSKRQKNGYSNYSNFADVVLAKYSCTEQLDSYVMDGFGRRVETTN